MVDCFEDEFTQAFATETIAGERVKLVGLTLSDAESSKGDVPLRPMSPERIFEMVKRSEDFLAEHLPWVHGTSVPDIAKRMRSWIFAEQYGQGGCWGVFARGSTTEATLAGFIMAEFNLKNHSATLSYWLSKDFTGNGLMTDAVKALARYCLNHLKLNRLELSVSVTNEKSLALARRCGFTDEGISRDFERINGIFVDHRRFSLLARDNPPWLPG